MTIEQRIDVIVRFQEAHEANLNRLFEFQAKNEQVLASVISGMSDLKQSVASLARIAAADEHRISDHEQGPQ